jgi:DNA-binding transcriptional LysR family regulator
MNQMTLFDIDMNMNHVVTALHGIDLNLLTAFDALAEERSVTRAAARAGVTQSAMSHTLRRLRELLDDPVLVRGAGGMVLTPRAEALRAPLRAALADLARALTEPVDFEPCSSTRAFRLVAPDLFDMLALPRLLPHLAAHAPGVDLAIVPRPPRLAEALEAGEVDLAIEPILLDEEPFDRRLEAGPALERRTLFRDHLRCFVRREHPAINKSRRLSMRAFVAAGHVLVSPTGSGAGVVDRYLAREGKQRRVVVRVPQFGSALAIAAHSELVLTAPSAVMAAEGAEASLVSLAAPLTLPHHAVTMLWHPRFTEDPGHRWFRDTLVEVSAGLATGS